MLSSDNTPTVLVLDAGFSGQLSRHVETNPDGDPLWCARFLQTNPDGVYKTHLDFLRAGADIISTNTYQASVAGFVKYLGVTSDEGYDIITHAVELAKHARCDYLEECRRDNKPIRTIQISGSVGPYGAYLHDGSEYDGSYADKVSIEMMREWHTPRIKALVSAGVDLLAFETLPCVKEAEVLIDMLKEYPHMKGYVSFSCKDDSLANGENFKMAVEKCWDLNPEQLIAIGVNCCPPALVTELLGDVNVGRQSKIPFITYPNSGEKYRPQEGWTEGVKCAPLADYVQEWLELGVRYIGGCCRTYDSDVTQIKEQVRLWLENKTKC